MADSLQRLHRFAQWLQVDTRLDQPPGLTEPQFAAVQHAGNALSGVHRGADWSPERVRGRIRLRRKSLAHSLRERVRAGRIDSCRESHSLVAIDARGQHLGQARLAHRHRSGLVQRDDLDQARELHRF
jgi:hypothetical protein